MDRAYWDDQVVGPKPINQPDLRYRQPPATRQMMTQAHEAPTAAAIKQQQHGGQ